METGPLTPLVLLARPSMSRCTCTDGPAAGGVSVGAVRRGQFDDWVARSSGVK